MNKEKTIIRKMLPGDLRAIVEIDKKIIGKDRAASWPQHVNRYLERYYPPLCHVAEIDGKVVGFIFGDVRGWEYALPPGGWIDLMGIDPDYHRRGIGKKLVDAFVKECRQHKMKTHVTMRSSDERVQFFFQSSGFKRGNIIDFEI